MANKEINLDQDIAPGEVAFALGVSARTVNTWLNDRTLDSFRDFNGRRRVPIRELFRLAEQKGLADQPAGIQMRERLERDIMPKYRKGRAQGNSKNVLSLV